MKRLVPVMIGVLIGVAAPVAARTVVDFARNAGHVNGFRAVASSASDTRRAGKLVATDSEGWLPDFIVRQVEHAMTTDSAADSANLGGIQADHYQRRCTVGTVFGYVLVPGNTPSSRTEVEGFSCFGTTASVEHPAAGSYLVDMSFQTVQPCQAGQTKIPAVVTVNDFRRLLATYETICGSSGRPLGKVHISDTAGTPIDADFTVLVPRWVGAPVMTSLPPLPPSP
ncbi:MAG TPA: hypothetical protein VNC78_02095 [Actinomycetota bacterium]|nr:hypothetical protein [Actinomycetota bacterium]